MNIPEDFDEFQLLVAPLVDRITSLFITSTFLKNCPEDLKTVQLNLNDPHLQELLKEQFIELANIKKGMASIIKGWALYKINKKFTKDFLKSQEAYTSLPDNTSLDLLFIQDLSSVGISITNTVSFLKDVLSFFTKTDWLLIYRGAECSTLKNEDVENTIDQLTKSGISSNNYVEFINMAQQNVGQKSEEPIVTYDLSEASEVLTKLRIVAILIEKNSNIQKNCNIDLKDPELLEFLKNETIGLDNIQLYAEKFCKEWYSYKILNVITPNILDQLIKLPTIYSALPKDILFIKELMSLGIPAQHVADFLGLTLTQFTKKNWFLVHKSDSEIEVPLEKILSLEINNSNYLEYELDTGGNNTADINKITDNTCPTNWPNNKPPKYYN